MSHRFTLTGRINVARWMFLTFLNCAAVTIVMDLFVIGGQALPPGVLPSLIFSLGFPLALLLLQFELPFPSQVGLLSVNSLLWALIVDALLRRFVDRPQDSGSE